MRRHEDNEKKGNNKKKKLMKVMKVKLIQKINGKKTMLKKRGRKEGRGEGSEREKIRRRNMWKGRDRRDDADGREREG